ncbi:MAG: cell division protein FtsL [Kangiellaceae bacterium]
MKKDNNQKGTKSSKNPPSLLGAVVVDVFIKRWFLTLLVVVAVLSAMQKVKNTHSERRAIAKLQLLKEQNQQLQIEWQSLNLEMTALSESDRVFQLAKNELNMIKVNSNNEKIINL